MSGSKIKEIGVKMDVTKHTMFDEFRPYERAARKLCEKLGIDPDAMVDCPNPTGVNIPANRKQWIDAAQDLTHFSMCLTSLNEAAMEMSEEEKANSASFPKTVN